MYWKKILKTAIFFLLINFFIPHNSYAYTGWPGSEETKDLGKEAIKRQKAKDFELAIQLHEEIIKLEPCNVWAYEQLGDIQKVLKQYDFAIFYYTKAQEVIKCNKTGKIRLDDFARIGTKANKANELKKATKPKKKNESTKSRFRKGDKVFFEAISMLFKHKYKVKGVIVTPGNRKSRVKIIDNGGSIYINREVYRIENSVMKMKKR